MQNSFAKGSQYGFATFYSGKCQHQWAKPSFQGLMSTDCRVMEKGLADNNLFPLQKIQKPNSLSF
jgi:hypothetical protein